MNNDRVQHLKELGVTISLTKLGLDALTDIMSSGCPVKMSCDGYEPVSCPLHWSKNKYTCRRCWREWLSSFVKED